MKAALLLAYAKHQIANMDTTEDPEKRERFLACFRDDPETEGAPRAANTKSAPIDVTAKVISQNHDDRITGAVPMQDPRTSLVPKANPGRVADFIRDAYRTIDGLWRSSQRDGGDYAWLDLNGIRMCVRSEGSEPALVLWRGPANCRKWHGMAEAAWGLAFTAAHYEREKAATIIKKVIVPEHDWLTTVGPERGIAGECPVCNGWGKLIDRSDPAQPETVPCSVCDGTGGQRNTTLYMTRQRIIEAHSKAAGSIPL